MLVTEILKQGFRVSVELVPSMIDRERHPSLEETLTKLDAKIKPSFISVTQGSGGTSREQSPVLLQKLQGRELCAHLITGFVPKAEALRHAANFYAQGIRNFLVLKGDKPPTYKPSPDEYAYTHESIRDLKQKYPDIAIGVAAYPDAKSENDRIHFTRAKHQAGADFAITQMLFNAHTYKKYVEDLNLPDFPVLPGVCFIHDQTHAEKFAKRFEVKIPTPTPPPHELIEDFKEAGAPGVHLFLLDDLERL